LKVCLRTLRILVADDSPNVREMLMTALALKGYEVSGVSDGEEALAKVTAANVSERQYDAVLLDYAMPGMDGLTCALRIRADQGRSTAIQRKGADGQREKAVIQRRGADGLRESAAIQRKVADG
jgi:CheY-like chemotaxis protein